MINYNYFLLLFAFLLLHTYNINGQVKIKDKELKKATEKIFNSYEDIDSICLNFYEGKPEVMFVYQSPASYVSPQFGATQFSISHARLFNLNFEGDTVWLNKLFPKLHKMIFADKHFSKVQKRNKELKKYTVSLTKRHLYIGSRRAFNSIYSELKHSSIDTLVDRLNTAYHDSIVNNYKDSIIIVQAVVNRNGSVEHVELVYGENISLYSYFLQAFNPYLSKSLFEPYINSAGESKRSISDIFIKIKKDHTFVISSRGGYRTFRLKNYQKDPSNPIYY